MWLSEIVQFWYNTKARLLALLFSSKKMFVQSPLSLRVDLSAVSSLIQLYDSPVSLHETNRNVPTYVNFKT